MRQVFRKWFWVWDFDKEEIWLNEMAAKGLQLSSVGYCRYEFEPCQPGEYTIRLELLNHPPGHAESKQYIAFLEETHAEYIGFVLSWVYFRKKTIDGAFDLFSDNSSRIKHLDRILLLIAILGGYNLFVGLHNLSLFYSSNINHILGFFNLALACFLGNGFRKINRKKRNLKKEQQLFE